MAYVSESFTLSTWAAEARQRILPVARNELPRSASAVVDNVPASDADSYGVVVLLLFVMAGLGYAFVESFGEKDAALSVVLAAAFIGCSVIIYVIVRGLWAIRRGAWAGQRCGNIGIGF